MDANANAMINLGINHSTTSTLTLGEAPIQPKEPKRSIGRPTVMTKDVLQKLEDAFAFCYTDEEACLYAGISPRTLYTYQEENPAFAQRKETLRLTPNLMAKKQLVEAIKGNTDQSRWWAQHKMSKEFAPTSKLELQTTDTANPPEAVRKVVGDFEKVLREAIIEERKKKP